MYRRYIHWDGTRTELGRKKFGVSYLCTNNKTGEVLVCKLIAKWKLTTKEDIEDLKGEMQIVHHLLGTPNVVGLKDLFEDRQTVHIVMERSTGGEFFYCIIENDITSSELWRSCVG